MAITPRDLLILARQFSQHPGEPTQRAAIGRAYYAAFHSCTAYAGGLPRPRNLPPGSHLRVIETLARFDGLSPDHRRQVRKLGQLLRQARDLRTRADYHLELDVTPDETGMSLAYAERIAELIGKLTPAT